MKKILIFATAMICAFTTTAQDDKSVNETPVQFQNLNQQQFEDQPANLFLIPVQYRPYNAYTPKKPALSWLFSFLTPGVGQFYNGDVGKGFGFLGTYVLGYGLMIYGVFSVALEQARVDQANQTNGYRTNKTESVDPAVAERAGLFMLGGVALSLTSWIWAQIDAPLSASRKNRENGYYSWDIGNGGAVLTLQPAFNLTPVPLNQQATLAPTYGAGLKLKF